MAKSIDYLIKKRETLKTLREPWNSQFEILARYIYSRKVEFQNEVSPGDFLNDGSINDSTASRSLQAMASALMGSLWKNGGKTFRLKRPDGIANNDINKEFYTKINKAITKAMESEKAGFELAFQESLCEQGAFGTGIPCVFEGDYKTPLVFKCWALQNCYIAESKDEFIDTIYYDQKMTVQQLVDKYGLDNVSEKARELYKKDNACQDKLTVCVAIEPRNNYEKKEAAPESNKAMEYSSCHFEVENKHVVKESGYSEIPAKVSRWYKLASEVYGRSPGMDALPTIVQLNAMKESFIVGVEKKTEPPLFVLDDGSLGATTVDTSAGGLSVFNMSGRLNSQQPVGTIFDIGELQSLILAIEASKLEVLNHFLIDKLYDLNNKTRMTLGEAEIRYDIRSDSLSSVYARIFNEQLTPLIERSFNILFAMGLMGIVEEDDEKRNILEKNGIDPIIIPPEIAEAMLKGKDVYEIEYISPAARLLREAEKRGVTEVVNAVVALVPVYPDVIDTINIYETMEVIRNLGGAPESMMRSLDDAMARGQARATAQAEAQQAEMAKVQSEAAKNVGATTADVVNAGQPRVR